MEMKTFTQNTLVPIGVVVSVVVVVVGAVFYLSSAINDQKYTREKVLSLEARVDRIDTRVQSVDTVQATFNEKLTNIDKSLQELKNLILDRLAVGH